MCGSHTDSAPKGNSSKHVSEVHDFNPLYVEFKGRNERLLSMWYALDAKIGILLGFTVLVLLGVSTNEYSDLIAKNVH